MGKTLIRPDGSTVRVATDDEAAKLQTLGYREETPGLELERGMELGQEEHYTSLGQKALTAGEGFLSGLTLGATDFVLDGDDTKERAKRNSGVRMVSELAGGLAPVLPVKGLRFTPAGALTTGAEKAGVALGRGSATIEAGIRGVVEGAGVGANQAITESQMSGDPLTAETVLAGIGWGALYGGGLSVVGAKAAEKFGKKAEVVDDLLGPTNKEVVAGNALERAKADATAHGVIQEGMKERHAAVAALEDAKFDNFRGTVQDVTEQLGKAKKTVVDTDIEALIKEAQDAHPKPRMELRPLKADFQKYESSLIDSGDIKLVKREMKGAQKLINEIAATAERGDYLALQESLDSFANKMTAITDSLGGAGGHAKMIRGAELAADKLQKYQDDLAKLGSPIRDEAAKRAGSASEELARITSVHKELSSFPKTAEEFTNMTAKRVERLGAAVDQLGTLKSAEFAGIQEGVKTALENLNAGLGVSVQGTPGQQVRGVWQLLKEARGKRATDFASAQRTGSGLWDRTRRAEENLGSTRMGRDSDVVARSTERGNRVPWAPRYIAGSWAANKAGGGTKGALAYATGSWLVGAMMGMKGAVLGTISEKASKWVPKVGRGVAKVGPRVEPLMTRLDGMAEDRRQSREDLMRTRAREITEAAPGVRDSLYRSLQPLAISNPDLAAAMHAHAVARYQFLLSKMPKDPGLAYSNLKSLWKPDPIAVEKFARYYEVFQNPVAVATRAIESGKITLEAAEGLREMNPEIFNYLRAEMLNRILDPKVAKSMKYSDQVHMGVLLDMPLHSTMDPRFIAPQQQMFTERNQPLEMNPRIQPGGGAGRPSGPGPSATSAQRTTEH